MANTLSKQLDLPMLAKIHRDYPDIGKALELIVDHIRKNVVPLKGTKVG